MTIRSGMQNLVQVPLPLCTGTQVPVPVPSPLYCTKKYRTHKIWVATKYKFRSNTEYLSRCVYTVLLNTVLNLYGTTKYRTVLILVIKNLELELCPDRDNTKFCVFSLENSLNSRRLIGTVYRYGTKVYLQCSRDLLSDRGTKFINVPVSF
eukprot:SAG11_NODE_5072_length_1672_cov_7.991736_2_plen_151_part_00